MLVVNFEVFDSAEFLLCKLLELFETGFCLQVIRDDGEHRRRSKFCRNRACWLIELFKNKPHFQIFLNFDL